MTLIKKDEDVQPEFDPAAVMKMEKFILQIKELAVYLGNFRITSGSGLEHCFIDSVNEYTNRILNNNRTQVGSLRYSRSGFNFFCITGNNGKSSNIYCRKAIEILFPAHNLDSASRPNRFGTTLLSYGCSVENYGWNSSAFSVFSKTDDSEYRINVWRDDLHFPKDLSLKCFINVLKSIEYFANEDWWCTWWVKYYNIFWNLFIIALDEDAYNNQLSDVIELAHYWDFDEHMLRDWCRAVEYVMNGNKLSENCDFECETVEGARFFLHQEYDDDHQEYDDDATK